jgi:predicted metal-dependent peptidase
MNELITLTPDKIVQVVKIKMLRTLPFFGVLLMSTPFKRDNSISTACTTGKAIYINEDFAMRIYKKNGVDGLIFTVAHEIMHIALGHIWREGKRDHSLWNIATDAEINQLLYNMGVEPIEGSIMLDEAVGKTAEEIYKLLEDQLDKQQQDQINGDNWDEHETWGMDEDSDDGISGGEKQHNSKFRKLTDAEMRNLKKEVERKIVNAYNSAKDKGNIPAALQRMIEEITNPQLDWRSILSQFIQPSHNDYSFCPPDRRFSTADFSLPSLSDEALENIVIAIDTSGSIDYKMLEQFVGEALGILHCYPTVKAYFCSCDAELYSWLEADNNTSVKSILENIKGGGGTDFRPVFKKAENDFVKPSALIFCTDTYGDFPDKTPDYPVLWVIPQCYKNRSNVPFGVKVFIGTE